jgi:arylsulfatase A-like enzyme
VVGGVVELLRTLHEPSLAYLHLYPPHGEYRPKGKFNHMFEDGWEAPRKPIHPLVHDVKDFERQDSQRRRYDQYLASWDAELARLFEYLDASGLLETSHVIITSDHGELFERGVVGHSTPLIYEPIVHVPLFISRPGQTERADVRTATSSVDLLPTIAALAAIPIPAWAEGGLLPDFGGNPDVSRSIYSMDAKTNSAFGALDRLSVSLLKNDRRLTYYRYPNQQYEAFELYSLGDDPDELSNVYSANDAVAAALREELLAKLAAVNREFTA